jgi:hypothetical protein
MNVASRLGDLDIRSALRSLLIQRHENEHDTVLLEELGFCRGQARIDLVVVNGLLHGYEIKSDRDSIRRLAGQVGFFSKVLDLVTLVVGERLLTEALDLVPEWWGVVKVSEGAAGLEFQTLRDGRTNPRRDPRALVELLWLDSALALLESRGAVRGLRGKPRRAVWDCVCEHCDLEEISAAVRKHLKARTTPEFVLPLS